MELLPFRRILYTNDEKFTEMAQHAYQVLKAGMNLREDLYFIVINHQVNHGTEIEPFWKIKTLGQHLACITPNSVNPQHIMMVEIPSQAA